MDSCRISPPFLAPFFLCTFNLCSGSRKLFNLYHPPPMALTYHNGAFLEGDHRAGILWYGKFSPPQKSIIVDFLASLDGEAAAPGMKAPTASKWWQTVQIYLQKAGKKRTHLILSNQISHGNCSMGKLLKKTQVTELARRVRSKQGGLTIVLTAEDVAVEGFCMNSRGYHGDVEKAAFVCVGHSAALCPGECPWHFHRPIYGPRTNPLIAPNGDVGVDGMVVNIGIAGAVRNPFKSG